ncbi:MAG: diguanylate cyclase [Candidatus Cloacimonetes bacterium]|jgi:diguanylate cyclase (GGDEF)-like protein|nr:diguanylate cyclase [Candidatus Cloacimonadota bacterium]MBT4332665.1 diguanylate cyclase [Candidatus Cloacimonadota bacterium]
MKKKKILIVEDSTLIQLRLYKMLLSSGYDVVGKTDSHEEALAYTKKFNPDMILMDIILIGKYDGIMTAMDIKKFSDAGIIYLTGNSSDKMIARARKTKPLGYLIKPYNDRQLNVALDMAFTRQELILELQAANKNLKKLSRRDTLTKLPNRRDLIEHLQYNIHRYERYQQSFSVILADIDDFKMINDTYGHNAGDLVLRELSHLFTNFGRKQDTVGRWGGEEFLFILVSVTENNGAMLVAKKIRSHIEDHTFRYKDNEIKITLTFGVSTYNSHLSLDEIIKQADDALYKGKEKGKNCIINSNTDY